MLNYVIGNNSHEWMEQLSSLNMYLIVLPCTELSSLKMQVSDGKATLQYLSSYKPLVNKATSKLLLIK